MSRSIAEDVAMVGRIDVVPKLLEVVCRTTGMGFAAVARVTQDHWIACAVRDEIDFGLTAGDELVVSTTICSEIRDSGKAVVIDHVAENPRFRDHHTPKTYGFQSYISVPIRYRGEFFGTLCAIDPRPARVEAPEVVATFELFADLLGRHMDAEQRLAESEAALIDARAASELREQFIAVLGHDLRNPLASIDGGARLLLKTPLNDILGMCAVCMDETQIAKIKHSLKVVYESGNLLLHLLEDLLSVSKNQIGHQITIDPKEFRLIDMRSQILSIFDKQAREEKIDFSVTFVAAPELTEPDVMQWNLDADSKVSVPPQPQPQSQSQLLVRFEEERLWRDQHRILQVIINLVSNSLKFTPPNGRVSVQIKCVGEDLSGKDDLSRTSSKSYSRNSRSGRVRYRGGSSSVHSMSSGGILNVSQTGRTALAINPMDPKPTHFSGSEKQPLAPPPYAKAYILSSKFKITGWVFRSICRTRSLNLLSRVIQASARNSEAPDLVSVSVSSWLI